MYGVKRCLPTRPQIHRHPKAEAVSVGTGEGRRALISRTTQGPLGVPRKNPYQ